MEISINIKGTSAEVKEVASSLKLNSDTFNVTVNGNEVKAIPEGYVDLGLPSGTLWAKCNLGAQHEWESGKYYQWGDTVGYYAGEGAEEHSSGETLPFKFRINEAGLKTRVNKVAPNGILHKKYDAVYQATNGQAHMPTEEQLEELVANTTNKWAIIDGVHGYKFVSRTDASKYIFIPASGFFVKGRFDAIGCCGYMLASSLYTSHPSSSWNLYFNSVNEFSGIGYRYFGQSVRGVIG